jgi:hypothetical protein
MKEEKMKNVIALDKYIETVILINKYREDVCVNRVIGVAKNIEDARKWVNENVNIIKNIDEVKNFLIKEDDDYEEVEVFYYNEEEDEFAGEITDYRGAVTFFDDRQRVVESKDQKICTGFFRIYFEEMNLTK